jgi:hypothetical protein
MPNPDGFTLWRNAKITDSSPATAAVQSITANSAPGTFPVTARSKPSQQSVKSTTSSKPFTHVSP